MATLLKIMNPATETQIAEMEEDSPQSIERKYQRARQAQPRWADTPLASRRETIRKFRDLVIEQKEKLALTLTSEVGKPIAQSRNELGSLVGRIDFFLEKTAGVLEDEVVFSDAAQGMFEKISHEPLGVIANISAWNYPYFVGSNVFVPALLTGNTVLYKPSEFSTLTGLAITELLHRAGVPVDTFIPIIGAGQAGASLLAQPVNGVFFTGSYATGRKINETVAGRLLRVQLELGGKDPVYVRDDADVPAAAEATADGAFYNTGQSCCSVERIYVHARVFDAFVDHFVKTVKGFVIGDPLDEKTYIGPLARAAQLGILERQIADARARGATCLTGGKRMNRDKGHYFEPTVFVNATSEMELMREESFGPIIGIQKVESDERAVELMNNTAYGLTAGVYSRDGVRAQELLRQVNAGSVYWNCCDRVSPRLPWSGRGNSGIGLTLSTYGIRAFLQPKAWHLRTLR